MIKETEYRMQEERKYTRGRIQTKLFRKHEYFLNKPDDHYPGGIPGGSNENARFAFNINITLTTQTAKPRYFKTFQKVSYGETKINHRYSSLRLIEFEGSSHWKNPTNVTKQSLRQERYRKKEKKTSKTKKIRHTVLAENSIRSLLEAWIFFNFVTTRTCHRIFKIQWSLWTI